MSANTELKVPLFYIGGLDAQRREINELPEPALLVTEETGHYAPDAALVRAVNVALTLRMPLLLTGEPGVGKTRLASALAHELALPFEELTVTSETGKRDVLYAFDELGRLRDSYSQKDATDLDQGLTTGGRGGDANPPPMTAYIAFRGLGRAILRAAGPDAPLEQVEARGKGTRFGAAPRFVRDLVEDLSNSDKRLSVLLIDEIDKASRDLPNDLLTELDRMQFDIPELGVRVKLGRRDPWPIVVITSNSERSLPEPFLRRCVYHHIDFPKDALRNILQVRLGNAEISDVCIDDALSLVEKLRSEESQIVKRPGTAEILSWLRLLVEPGRLYPAKSIEVSEKGLKIVPYEELAASLAVLLKTPIDLQRGGDILRQWRSPSKA